MAKVDRKYSGESGSSLDSYREIFSKSEKKSHSTSSKYSSSYDKDKQLFLEQLAVRLKSRENVSRFRRSLWVRSPSPPLLTSDSDQEPS